MESGDLCYSAMRARDARFDGCFVVGVTSTGIYCRPSCASVVPRRRNVRFYRTAAAAQKAGFRACKRCRPDAAPGSPEWDRRGDTVARAMTAIADGVVDRAGVAGLASLLGYSDRQLRRLLVSEVGAGPLDLAKAQRASTARLLLETTTLRMAEVAFAAGFGSVRQFNDTIRTVFGETPGALRARRIPDGRARFAASSGPVEVELRLSFRPPLAAEPLFSFLAARAVGGVESGDAGRYVRALRLPRAKAVVSLRRPEPGASSVSARIRLEDVRDLTVAADRVRHLFDLDCDPLAVSDALVACPYLGASVRREPGRRVPGTPDPDELSVRAVLGQQVSVAAARTVAARLAESYGEPLGELGEQGVERTFPSADALAGASPDDLPMPRGRARALIGLATAIASGRITLMPGADREEASRLLLELPGIGPWTVGYVRMRALRDPDAFMATDLGVRKALSRLTGASGDVSVSEKWRPYRAYGVQYLWAEPAVRPEYAREDVA